MKKLTLALGVIAIAFSVKANSPYITKVYDFLPAPGQFINTMPEYEEGDTKATILTKVEEQICGNDDDGATPGMISLGSYGGYVVFGFDHPVVNVTNEYDFKIYGNAFKSNQASDGGSCEPGIVMVSQDENKNGLPDDEWYELAGSEYAKPETIRKYKITYTKPDDNRAIGADPDPNNKYICDCTYIKWIDNQNVTGYVMRNVYHRQSYWPMWIDDAEISFEGSLLADNAYDQSGNGSYFVLTFYDWGYVDNQPNTDDPGFKIGWAVDANGNSVTLSHIDFIKVYSAVNQYCGWIGETSTEVCGGEDLHPNAVISSGIENVTFDDDAPIEYYNLHGVQVVDPKNGIFIKKQGRKTSKIIL